MEIFFSSSDRIYKITFESIHRSDFLKLLPEVEEIVNSIQVKNS
jgi:hypothetical protein